MKLDSIAYDVQEPVLALECPCGFEVTELAARTVDSSAGAFWGGHDRIVNVLKVIDMLHTRP